MVPEHIETRSLYNPHNPNMEYGKIEMWIDMFPMSGKIPKSVDISLRKPLKFQLRIVIKNVEDVTLDDVNPLTGERTSDIYIKGFLCNENLCTAQKTDIHYRSMSGEGNFNWRFVFDFEYLPSEELIIFQQKTTMFSSKTELIKEKPIRKTNHSNLYIFFKKINTFFF